MTSALLLWGLLFGSIGFGMFLYGKRQAAPVPLICGGALMLYPLFVSNTYIVFAVGLALTILPWFLRI